MSFCFSSLFPSVSHSGGTVKYVGTLRYGPLYILYIPYDLKQPFKIKVLNPFYWLCRTKFTVENDLSTTGIGEIKRM